MTVNFLLNLLGLLLNIIGTTVLTFSLSKYLTSIHGAIAIHDMQMNALIKKSNKLLEADVANLLKHGVEDNRRKTIGGLVILTIGFILQLVPYVLELLQKVSS